MRELERAIAFHESGHAIIARLLGVSVRSVEIAAPRASTLHGNAGELVYTHNADKPVRAVDQAMICLGGGIAQLRACPGSVRGDRVDLQLARDAAIYLSSNPRLLLDRLHFRTRLLVDENWPSIAFLAGALMARGGRLTGAEIDGLFRCVRGSDVGGRRTVR